MNTRLIGDEAKRQSNLRKHGFDFADASEVLEGTSKNPSADATPANATITA